MRPYHDPSVLTEHALRTVKSIVTRFGVPAAWTETEHFKDNLVRLFTAQGKEAGSLFMAAASATSHPRLAPYFNALGSRFESVGGALMFERMFLALGFDQSICDVQPPEVYEPMHGFTPAFAYAPLDLTEARFKDRFYFDYERADGSVDEDAIDRALATFDPQVVAVGSGPGNAAALTSILDRRPHTRVMVLDIGDYFRQADYDARTPANVCFETFRNGGAMPIFNSATRVTVNAVPQVWGGGAEIFSGTAHHLAPWYLERMPMSATDAARHEARVRQDCRVSRTPWEILNDGQKRYFTAAKTMGYEPYLLEGFGRGGDTGNGRCYGGKKERIPYMDNLFRRGVDVVGLANCRVQTVLRDPDGTVAAIELEFLSRATRQVIATRTLDLPHKCRVLLAASSLGNQRILTQSGDPIALSNHVGVKHQYTCEVAAIFDDALSANGIPQGMGLELEKDKEEGDDVTRRVLVEGAHPGRAMVGSMGVPYAKERMKTWNATPRIATVGIMFTESKGGLQMTRGTRELSLQRLTNADFDRATRACETAMKIWFEAGARGVCLNTPASYTSGDAEMASLGFIKQRELGEYMGFVRKHPPVMQVFYRTGHRFGTVDKSNGEVRGFKNLHLVGEDVIPPGPGVNPTLGILMLAHHYGEAISETL